MSLGATGGVFSREGWELERPGVAFNLKQSEKAFRFWSKPSWGCHG